MQMIRNVQPQVFVSYSRDDAPLARRLARELQERGAATWLDIEELAPGDSLFDQISAAIRNSDIFLVIVSPSSSRSQWVQRELGMALATENKTRVVPVLMKGARPPSDLRDVLYLSADPDDLGAAADEVLRASKPIDQPEDSMVEIEKTLASHDLQWRREPAIAGVRPDFLLETTDGRRIVIEVSARPNPGLIEAVDARSQAARIRDLVGADDALVVVPSAKGGLPGAGIVGASDLDSHLASIHR